MDFNQEIPEITIAHDTVEETVQEIPADKVCTPCLENNLLHSGVIDTLRKCDKCGEEYCIHGASKLDPRHCIFCCNDFQVVDIQESVVREVSNSKGEVTSRKTYAMRHITLSGLHWQFYNRAITDMSDVELEHAIEYHRSILNGMLAERETRRLAHIARNKGKKAGNEAQSLLSSTVAQPLIQTGGGARASFSTTTTKRTRTVKTSASGASASEKKQDNLMGALATLLKSGLTAEQIAALGKK